MSDALSPRVCSCLQVEVQLRPTAREAFQRIKTVMQEAQPLTDGGRLQSLADRPINDVSGWLLARASSLAAGLHCSETTPCQQHAVCLSTSNLWCLKRSGAVKVHSLACCP